MDQMTQVFLVLKKYHFWILVVAILMIGAGLWAKASSDLAGRYADRKKQLTDARKGAFDITSVPNPANEKVIDAIKQQTRTLQGDVLDAWRFLYFEQKKNNAWPSQLSPAFLETVNALDEDEEIPSLHRIEYARFISLHLPTLDTIVDRRRLKEVQPEAGAGSPTPLRVQPPRGLGAAAAAIQPGRGLGAAVAAIQPGRGAGRAGEDLAWEGKVDWLDVETVKQQFILPTHPGSKRIRLAQEDLWVYRALLHIVRNTNSGATSYSNAAIKVIENLEIGRRAVGAFQSIGASAGTAGGAAARRAGGSDERRGTSGLANVSAAIAGGGGVPVAPARGAPRDVPLADREVAELYEGRYVDQFRQPLAANAPSPFAEFQMMPVHMRFIMDPKKVATLLAECGNSSMPVEVHRVTIDSLTKPPVMGAPPVGMSRNERGMSRLGNVVGGLPAQDMGTGASPYGDSYARVDVLGIIYIFNPPNEATLGTGTASATPQDVPAADVQAPAEKGAGPGPPAGAPPVGAGPPAATPPGGTRLPAAVPPAATPPAIPPAEALPGGAQPPAVSQPGGALPGNNGGQPVRAPTVPAPVKQGS